MIINSPNDSEGAKMLFNTQNYIRPFCRLSWGLLVGIFIKDICKAFVILLVAVQFGSSVYVRNP